MPRLEDIKDYIEKEYLNLTRSKNRARTLGGILTKRQHSTDALKDFTQMLEKYEDRLNITQWNKLTDDF